MLWNVKVNSRRRFGLCMLIGTCFGYTWYPKGAYSIKSNNYLTYENKTFLVLDKGMFGTTEDDTAKKYNPMDYCEFLCQLNFKVDKNEKRIYLEC